MGAQYAKLMAVLCAFYLGGIFLAAADIGVLNLSLNEPVSGVRFFGAVKFVGSTYLEIFARSGCHLAGLLAELTVTSIRLIANGYAEASWAGRRDS